MINQDTQLHDLPDYWQERIRRYRVENKRLRGLVSNADRLELPPKWQKNITDLRRENAKFRTERNDARAELAALRAQSVG